MNWTPPAQAEPARLGAAASVLPAASWPLPTRALLPRLPGPSSLLELLSPLPMMLQGDAAPGMANSPAKPVADAAPVALLPDPVPAS